MVATPPTAWRNGPAPVASLIHPAQAAQFLHDLRAVAASHDDTSWVHVQPLTTRDGYAGLTKDLLDAAGVVGTRQPRTAGERHMVRVGTHWIHSPVRHVIASEAQWVPPLVWAEVQDMALIAGVQLWLLIDASTRSDHAHWAGFACEVLPADELLEAWTARPVCEHLCPPGSWGLNAPARWPEGDCPFHANRVECFLSGARRALTLGATSPDLVRERLLVLLNNDSATVSDWWAATAAGRDFFTPAEDALVQLGVHTRHTPLGDIAGDGSSIIVDGETVNVPQQFRLALAGQATSRRLSGCYPDEPFLGVFENSLE